jgi:Ca2+-binding RTX toxin-like protein
MSLTPADYAAMSIDAYVTADDESKNIKEGFKRIISTSDPTTGFFGAAYYNDLTGELVISYRGTDDFEDWKTSNSAFLTDSLPNQFQAADAFAQTAIAQVALEYGVSVDASKIALTGHSLGGALAQLVSAATGYKATAFNSPGIAQCLQALENYLVQNGRATAGEIVNNQTAIAQQIEIYRASGDAVSLQGIQIESPVSVSVESPPFTLGHVIQGLAAAALGLNVLINVVLLFARRAFVDFHNMESLYDALQVQYGAVPAVDQSGDVLEEGTPAYEAEYQRQLQLLEGLTAIQDVSNVGDTPIRNVIADLSVDGQTVQGTSNEDLVIAVDGNDNVSSGDGNDLVYAGGGDDSVSAGSGNDILFGGAGEDWLNGGAGSDIYVLDHGSQTDWVVTDAEGPNGTPSTDPDRIRLAPGITTNDVAITRSGNWLYVNLERSLDRMILVDWMIEGANPVSAIEFSDGTTWDRAAMTSHIVDRANLRGSDEAEVYLDGYGDDMFFGMGGDDEIQSVFDGDDYFDGGSGDDYVWTSGGVNGTDDGSDIILGRAGDDFIVSDGGNDLIEGGDGVDELLSRDVYDVYGNFVRSASGLLIGGAGDDVITTNNGVIAFNRGDGNDVTPSYGQPGYPTGVITISLGGVGADDLYFSREDESEHPYGPYFDNLVMNIEADGSGGRLIFGEYYRAYFDEQIDVPFFQFKLQIITPENGIQLYDLDSVIAAHIAAGTPDAWSIQSALTTALISSSTDQAVGGDVAYRYALNGSTDLLTEAEIRTTLASADFANAPQLVHTAQQSIVAGTSAADVVSGTQGDDIVAGLGGNDSLDGGAGSDVYLFGFGDGVDTVNDSGISGSDTLRFGAGIGEQDISLGLGSLLLRVGGNGDAIHIGGFNPQDALNTGGIESFVFENGTTLTRAQLLARGFDLNGTTAADSLTGTNVTDRMFGDAGDDALSSGDGDDVLAGGAGADTLAGGLGNDRYDVAAGDGADVIQESGGAADVLSFAAGIAASNVTVSRNGLDVVLTGPSNTVTIDDWFAGDANKLESVKFADGTVWDKVYIDQLAGGSSNSAPTLANAIPDTQATETESFTFTVPENTFVDPDAGDTLSFTAALASGAALPSWLAFNGATRTFTGTPPDDAAGQLTVRVTATDTGGASAFDDFALDVANVVNGTSGADALVGTAGRDVMYGFEGSDSLDAAAGADTMAGGTGDDMYIVDDAGDVVVELEGGGSADVVHSSVSHTLGAWVDNLTLTGTSAINGTGNDLDNVLVGNSAANVLDGGAGNDAYYVLGSDTLSDSGGIDEVFADRNWTLEADFENLTLIGTGNWIAVGNNNGNRITGNVGNNAISGRGGDDFLYGGDGNDTFNVSLGGTTTYGTDYIDGGNGTDVIDWGSNALSAVTVNLATGTGSGGGSAGTGSMTFVNVEDAWGGAYNDSITGNSGANFLYGAGGNDTLDGGAGADRLEGGSGDDTYTLDSAGDVVVELEGGGADLVLSSVSHTLTAQVENLSLTGTATINGTGNELNNVLTGNNAANTLTGGDGNDVLDGGAGADTLNGGTGDDAYYVLGSDVLSDSGGIDEVFADRNWTLGADFENLTLIGTGNWTAVGNNSGNRITGNVGNNSISGRGGDDFLYGGDGDDVFNVSLGGTTTYGMDYIDGGNGTDVIDWGSNALSAVTVNLATGTGSGGGTAGAGSMTFVNVEDAWGGAHNDSITGNSGANFLYGAGGSDTLDGGAGADRLEGGTGSDTYKLGRGHGAETVKDTDSTTGNTDVAAFLTDIAKDQIWLQQSGNNLVVSVIGTSDQFTIQDWYLGTQHRLERFETANGDALLESNVQNLVDAMAAFTPPAPGQTTLPPAYATQLDPVISANWQ